LIVWPYSTEAAAEYGRVFTELRRNGRVMQQVDMQVAAIARTLSNCTVVSSDSDLLAVPAIAVENWAS
jgi:tRNA(fMet)-specific endonuclease VapC